MINLQITRHFFIHLIQIDPVRTVGTHVIHLILRWLIHSWENSIAITEPSTYRDHISNKTAAPNTHIIVTICNAYLYIRTWWCRPNQKSGCEVILNLSAPWLREEKKFRSIFGLCFSPQPRGVVRVAIWLYKYFKFQEITTYKQSQTQTELRQGTEFVRKVAPNSRAGVWF